MHKIDSLEMLEQIYTNPVPERAVWKEIDHVNELYRAFIEAAPFLILATHGEQGVDCSPRALAGTDTLPALPALPASHNSECIRHCSP